MVRGLDPGKGKRKGVYGMEWWVWVLIVVVAILAYPPCTSDLVAQGQLNLGRTPI